MSMRQLMRRALGAVLDASSRSLASSAELAFPASLLLGSTRSASAWEHPRDHFGRGAAAPPPPSAAAAAAATAADAPGVTRSFASRSGTVKRLQRASARAGAPRAPPAPAAATPAALEPVPPAAAAPASLAEPASAAEVAAVVGHDALVITRPVEWGSVLLGFEQAQRYTVYDGAGDVVAHIAEEHGGLGTAVTRQLLRTRRPFTATVLSPDGGRVIFRLRRPAYLISSHMLIEDAEGRLLGEVFQRWHLWQRHYDLYLDRRQFATIKGGFLAWDFTLTGARGEPLAAIDRNFSGFGKELFTDAGKYVVHFGSAPAAAAAHAAATVATAHPDRPPPRAESLLAAPPGSAVAVIPTSTGSQLAVARPLALGERMVCLAAAMSIDYDYFSRHGHGGGALSPLIVPPMVPFPVPAGGGAAAGGAAEGAAAAGGAAEGAAAGGGGGPDGGGGGGLGGAGGGAPLEHDLGGDGWEDPAEQGDQGGGWGSDGGGDDGDGEGMGLTGVLGSLMGWGEDD